MKPLSRMIAVSLLALSCGLQAQEPAAPEDEEKPENSAPAKQESAQPANDKPKEKSDVFKPKEEISEDYPVPLPADI